MVKVGGKENGEGRWKNGEGKWKVEKKMVKWKRKL